jgi:archaemetzincin
MNTRNLLLKVFLLLAAFVSIALAVEQAATPEVVKSFPAPDGRRSFAKLGDPRAAEKTIAQLKPLHKKLGRPEPGDWLESHPETGQTFQEYLRIKPVTPTGARHTIYVQPLGEFTKEQRQIVELSAEYLSLYFDRPVKLCKDMPLDIIPAEARRIHPTWDVPQILTTHVLGEVLKPRLPKDAAAYIAFTSSDLWPGEGWNFVFGQATLRDRVGVWSINRLGDPAASDDDFKLCLRRTLKIATHETGHMFSMKHCTAYECNMCGSNHQEESDRKPLYLCPECHAKLLWATAADPQARYKNLAAFFAKHGIEEEQLWFEDAAVSLDK